MARTKSALSLEIVPAWHAFVADLVPDGVKIQAAAGASADPRRVTDANSSEAVYFRRILNGEIGQPQPRRVWDTACGARSLGPPFAWCAGPLFLMAAGHFDYFVRVMLGVGESIPKHRLAELAAYVERAIEPAELMDAAHDYDGPLQREIRRIDATTWSDLMKQRAKRIARARGSRQKPRLAQLVWELDALEEVAFDEAFERIAPDGVLASNDQTALFPDIPRKRGKLDATKEKNPVVVTAALVTMHPEIGLAMQRRIVLSSLMQVLR